MALTREATNQTDFKFFFNCRQCGSCCGYYTLCVNLIDIYRLKYFFNIDFKEFVSLKSKKEVDSKEHIYFKAGQDEKITVLKNEGGSCFFLKDNKCSVQKHKPWVCLMYPLRYNEKKDLYEVKFHDICQAGEDKEITVKNFSYIKELYRYEIEKNSELILWANDYAEIKNDIDFFNFLNENYEETMDYLKQTENIFLKTRFL